MQQLSRRAYGWLTGDREVSVCKDIPAQACEQQPANYLLQLCALVCTKTGDKFIDPKIILAWLLTALSVPAVFLSLLVPIHNSFSLLPQVFVAASVQHVAHRKWLWSLGALGQAMAVTGIGLTALRLEGSSAGVAILAMIFLFSLSRGVCSVTQKDVLGKTVAKTRRGSLSGYADSVAGFIAIGLALWLLNTGARSLFSVGIILFAAAGLWVLAALIFAAIREWPSETNGNGELIRDSLKQISLLRDDAQFRLFIIARTLLLGSALAGPYYVLLGQGEERASLFSLGSLLLAASLASFLSGPIWGHLSDRSSRLTMQLSGLLAGLTGIGFLVINSIFATSPWITAGAIFLLYIAHSGVRIGRATQLVDMATADNRSAYTAVSNTVIGVMLLIMAAIASVIGSFSEPAVLLLFSLMTLAAALLCMKLEQVQ